jgi:hypothetical protein
MEILVGLLMVVLSFVVVFFLLSLAASLFNIIQEATEFLLELVGYIISVVFYGAINLIAVVFYGAINLIAKCLWLKH